MAVQDFRAEGTVASEAKQQQWEDPSRYLLVAAGDGAIMAGPVGTTPPMLDGGEWTRLFAGGTTQAARAGRDSLCQNRWRAREKRQS